MVCSPCGTTVPANTVPVVSATLQPDGRTVQLELAWSIGYGTLFVVAGYLIVLGLVIGCSRDAPVPVPPARPATVDLTVPLPPGQRAAAKDGVVWFGFDKGELLYVGMGALFPATDGGPPFPLRPQTWIEVGGEGKETVTLTPGQIMLIDTKLDLVLLIG